jgi:prepilin-type N-terminal cleavage/methylation domain-containing protein
MKIANRRHRSAFTLIEMLVVIVIIAILMASIVAVGSMVRANAARRNTLVTLHALQGMMKDYIDAGNAEPQPPNPWIYASPIEAYKQSAAASPQSDPVMWVRALKSDPAIAKNLDKLRQDNDSGAPKASTYTGPASNVVIVDDFGTPIRYVPKDPVTNKPGHFVSAGPDGKFAYSDPNLRVDDFFSYDPQ